jgi:CheY-like chemotaxis protein
MSRILVVDDSATIRKVVCAILERHGHTTAAAHDGAHALEVLADRGPFDLVLLDFVMPRVNGFQFCRALRAKEEWKDVPVVLMSAKSDKIREQFVQQTGAVDAISKPFDAEALVAVVEHAIARVQSGWSKTEPVPLLDEADIPPASLRTTREESAMRSRVAVEFGAKLVGALAPLLAKLPKDALADEPRILQALAGVISTELVAELAAALRGHEVDERGTCVLSGSLSAIPLGAVLQLLQIEGPHRRPLGAVLQLLQIEGLTGVLQIVSATSDVTITVRSGLVDLVQGRGAGDEFRLGRFFVEEGLVTPKEIDRLLADDAPSAGAGRLIGEILVDAGRITEEQLRAALVRQSSELIYEVLRWKKGRFELHARGASPLAMRARLAMPVASVVMEGVRRVDEWRVMEEKLGSFDAVLQPDPVSIEALGQDKLVRAERAVLEAIDGRRTIREIVAASHLSSFDACRILYQLLEARLVRRKAA